MAILPNSPSTFLFILLLHIPLATGAVAHRRPRQLSVNYYAKTCPHLEQLVGSVTSQQFKVSPISGPATIRLFFHDCFVEGCDGSILISTKAGSRELAEKEAEENKDLRVEGYDTVFKAKSLVETKCPGATGGPYYQVKKGRWDGKTSKATRVPGNIPRTNSTVDGLLTLFRTKGLWLQDMVVLSGAHTIGFAHCKQFISRLYDYKGTRSPDPTLDLRLLKELRMSCPRVGSNDGVVVPFDVTTPFKFDHAYYLNLEKKLGLLGSDQGLWMDPRTKGVVQEMGKDRGRFFGMFGLAMEKMGEIGVKRGRRHGPRLNTFMKMHRSLSSTLPCLTLPRHRPAGDCHRFPASRRFQVRAMRAVVQRVESAGVEVDGALVSEIGPGLVVLVGIHESDTEADADYICRKVLNMRLFTNEATGRGWDQNVMQKNYGVLLVSQFTLYGIMKGNKPDFHVAMPPQKAKPFYESVVEKFRKSYNPDAVKDGVFGAMMKVNLINDGPVTMQLDSSQPSKAANGNANDAEQS
ncbi:Peroxidase 19 [Linum grandiflorum]